MKSEVVERMRAKKGTRERTNFMFTDVLLLGWVSSLRWLMLPEELSRNGERLYIPFVVTLFRCHVMSRV